MSAEITETRTADGGRYAIDHGANGESELTYRLQNGRMLIDRTFTPPPQRGAGVAVKLTERAVSDARERGLSVVPVCPYVKVKMERDPALKDVLDPDWRGRSKA